MKSDGRVMIDKVRNKVRWVWDLGGAGLNLDVQCDSSVPSVAYVVFSAKICTDIVHWGKLQLIDHVNTILKGQNVTNLRMVKK